MVMRLSSSRMIIRLCFLTYFFSLLSFNFFLSESDKARKLVIEEANKAISVSGETSKALAEFKEQVDAKEAEELQVKIKELEELAAKAQNVSTFLDPFV